MLAGGVIDGSKSYKFRAERRCLGIATLAALCVSLGAASGAHAQGPHTLVVGYVSAGAPVSGASVSVYTPSGRRLKLRRKSDVNGFVTVTLPGRPRSVRLVASGGKVRGQKVNGSLEAIVAHPGRVQDVFLNPVSTVIAAYAARHPRASLALATRESRRLLRLKPSESIGRALLQVTRYFDGLAFLRTARAHGGLQRYVASLIRRGKPVAFRGRPPLGGWADTLSVASNAISAVSGIGSIVNDIIGWSENSESKIGQIWDAVQHMQSQLNAIQTSLDNIQAEIQSDFQQLKNELDISTYNQRVLPLKDLAGTAAITESDFQDLVNNATSPSFSSELASAKTQAIAANVNKIETEFNQANDVFRDALIGGGQLSTTSTFHYAANVLLASSASPNFITPTDSAQLQNFANYVLQYQALAFNLIVRWETHLSPHSPTTTVNNAVSLYLGSPAEAKNWLASQGSTPTAPPPHGDLHDQLTYLATIATVPNGTVVDHHTGLMWQSSSATTVDFGSLVDAGGSGIECGPQKSMPIQSFCPNLWNARDSAISTLRTADRQEAASTGLSGWFAPQTSDAQQLLRTKGIGNVFDVKSYYWDPTNHDRGGNTYGVFDDGSLCGKWSIFGPCSRPASLFDTMQDGTIQGTTGNSSTCSYGVGFSGWRGHTNCPLLYILLDRTPGDGEQYWPSQ